MILLESEGVIKQARDWCEKVNACRKDIMQVISLWMVDHSPKRNLRKCSDQPLSI
ncbi:hypothetical protein LguiA_034801 [Lonicera macranthoides]